LFFGPLEVFLSNRRALWFSLDVVLITITIISIVAILLISAILYVLPEKLNKYAIATLFGIGIGIFVQGHFLQADYGILDGREVQWHLFRRHAVINTLVWIFCVLVPPIFVKLKPDLAGKGIKAVAIIVVIVQVASVIFLFFTAPRQVERYMLTERDMFTLSQGRNVVVFVIDTFDSAYMNEILETFPEYKEFFADFTYYHNALGMYPTTKASIPYMLTGIPAKNQTPFDDYLSYAFDNSHLFSVLHENNFDIGVYTMHFFANEALYRNTINAMYRDARISSHVRFAQLLYQFTAVRFAPHIMKQYIWMYDANFYAVFTADEGLYPPYHVFIGTDVNFMRKLQEERVQVSGEGNSFRLYHLWGAHSPFTMNELALPIDSDERGDVISQTRGALLIVREYLNQLKELGIYDDTMVIITSDHGFLDARQSITLMIKNFDERQDFSISDAPISISDLIPTIANAVTGTNAFGQSIQDIDGNAFRPRTFLNYFWDDGWRDLYLPDVFEYVWIGEATDVMSGIWTGNVFSNNMVEVSDQRYMLGDVLSFSPFGGAGINHIRTGFSGGDLSAFGESTELALVLGEKPTENLLMALCFEIFTGIYEYKTLAIFVNNRLLTEERYQFGDSFDWFVIPASMFYDNELILRFEVKNGQTANHIANTLDERFISFIPTYLMIVEQTPGTVADFSSITNRMQFTVREKTLNERNPTLHIDFSVNGNSELVIGTGWHGQENHARWTSPLSVIEFISTDVVDLKLRIYGSNFDVTRTTNLIFNGHPVGQIDLSYGVVEFVLPAELVSSDGLQVIEIETEDAASPFVPSENHDRRLLGIYVSYINITRS